jgi:hypothetical protein
LGIDIKAASAPEFGRGGTNEENWILEFSDPGNAPVDPGLFGGD